MGHACALLDAVVAKPGQRAEGDEAAPVREESTSLIRQAPGAEVALTLVPRSHLVISGSEGGFQGLRYSLEEAFV